MFHLKGVERDNPYQVLGEVETLSKSTARKTEYLRGERMYKKRMPSPEKEQEKKNHLITGRIGLLPNLKGCRLVQVISALNDPVKKLNLKGKVRCKTLQT